MAYYSYHNRIRQRIENGEYIGYEYGEKQVVLTVYSLKAKGLSLIATSIWCTMEKNKT